MDGPPRSVVSEPRGMTIADIAAMVAGVSIVMVMPWFGWQPGIAPWFRGDWDWNRIYMITGHLGEVIERLCLALTFVVCFRRLRYRGVSRSGEFLIPFIALQLLLIPRAGMPKLPGLESPAERWGTLIILGITILMLGLGRRKLPGSIKTALLVLAALLFQLVDQGIILLLPWLDVSETNTLLMEILLFPGLLIFTMPFSAALMRGRGVRSWLEWAGMVLCGAWMVLIEVNLVSSAMLSDPIDEFLKLIAVGWVGWLIAFVVSILLIRRFGRALRGWIEPQRPVLAE